MTLTELERCNELIDAYGHGTIYYAIENRKTLIARRLSEEKQSPRAENELALLLSLSPDYRTPKQIQREENIAQSGGYID